MELMSSYLEVLIRTASIEEKCSGDNVSMTAEEMELDGDPERSEEEILEKATV